MQPEQLSRTCRRARRLCLTDSGTPLGLGPVRVNSVKRVAEANLINLIGESSGLPKGLLHLHHGHGQMLRVVAVR
jgi:hypothetical protein